MENGLTVTNQFSIQAYATDLKGKLEFCKYMLESALCPKHFKSPADVLSCILYGQEIGLSPMQSLQTLYIVNGVPTLPSAGIKAKVIQAGGKFKTISWDASHCKLSLARGDWVEEFEYTLEDAKRAGLLSKDVWQKHPKQMLYARASTVLGRNVYPDVLKGLQAREEMEDEIVAVAQPVTQKFDEFLFDVTLLNDEAQIKKASAFCEENGFESMGGGVYKSILDSKKLAKCKITREMFEARKKTPETIEERGRASPPSLDMQDDLPGEYAQEGAV